MNEPYKIREDTIFDDSGTLVTVYGLDILDHGISIPDIFTSRSAAEAFIKLCNQLDISPVHIMEVIEDIL